MSRLRGSMIVVAFAAILGVAGCRDFHLSTAGLDIGPNPAFPGDTVVASFILDLIPAQRHTIIVHIDDTELMRVTDSAAPTIPVILELGDAADIIADHGVGEHVLQVEVQAHDSGGSTRTRAVVLELRESN